MRWLMAGAVLIVAAIAAVVSYIHIEHLAVTHGQTWLAALLLPISVDGTITAASLALLYAARAGLPSPLLGRLMLGPGVAATVAANAVEGASGGVIGVMVSAWPAVAFIGGIELLIWAARTSRLTAPEAVTEPASVTAVVTAPETQQPSAIAAAPRTHSATRSRAARPSASRGPTPAAAERRYADQLAAGELPSMRAIQRDLKVGQCKAQNLRAHLAATAAA